MNLLGFFLGYHDSNLCFYSTDWSRLEYFKSERMLRIKHHQANFDFVKQMCMRFDFKPDVIAYADVGNDTWSKTPLSAICPKDKLFCKKDNNSFFNCDTFCVDHHYAHILSSWPVASKADIGIAIDGCGDHELTSRVIANPFDLNLASILFSGSYTSVATFLKRIGRLMNLTGLSDDFAGKIMGAQAYGTVDYDYVNSVGDVSERINDLIDLISWRGKPLPSDFFRFDNLAFRDWLASVHTVCGNIIGSFFDKWCKPQHNIVYSGGCALNTVFNELLIQRYKNLSVPPHCYDGGLSLGCLKFLQMWYGLPDLPTSGFPYWQHDFQQEGDSKIDLVADLLADGKIVGWYQGRGEIGPRALGNRSILMDPRVLNGKDILNYRVKHREHWRPYAPAVLEKESGKWFNTDYSPYMLRAAKVLDGKQGQIPSVVHVDGTSRIQTVKSDNLFGRLIERFYQKTGVPMLLNTSFNSGGSPIFSSRKQCLDLFNNSEIDAVCMGDTLKIK